ncbi:hypothetical protein [Legionella drancourtii]|uniref:hypothetical protein n=1 Tax=Legionella drancourtii TaxID=168933 RepID=UPI00058F2F7B
MNSLIKSLKSIPKPMQSFIEWMLKLLLLLIIIPIFVPLAPKMPDSGIDPSWATALNQAIAQKLSFGKEIIFTLGPYSAIYTKVYHPATDLMMILGSLYLAISYWIALLILMKNTPWRWILAFIGLLSAMMYVKDSLFFSYPLLLGLISYKSLVNKDPPQLPLTLWFLLFAPLGLLVLIKCSLIMISLTSIALCALLFIESKKYHRAAICFIAPFASMLLCWGLARQALADLPSYLLHSIYFVFVFTEAMAKDGNSQEIVLYLISSALILCLIYQQKQTTTPAKLFLLALFGIFLFLSFKTGFTRHNHAIICGTSILIAALLLPFVCSSKFRLAVIAVSIGTGIYITSQYRVIAIKDNLISTYSSSWYGLKSRINDTNWLKRNFELIMSFQRAQASIPLMQGTTDIYSYEQTYLIASENNWSPRPVFQSYSTFAPLLAEKNKEHLESAHRPDNIVFRIEPIDNRIPSLEDSASWPLLIKNYQLTHQDSRFLYLQKAAKTKATLSLLKNESHRLGEVINVPSTNQLLFIAVDIKPSLLGFINVIFFKISQLEIIFELENGERTRYRLSANMAKSSFLISPLIETTNEFAFLYREENHLANKRVKSFVIQAEANTTRQWQNEYFIHFKTL